MVKVKKEGKTVKSGISMNLLKAKEKLKKKNKENVLSPKDGRKIKKIFVDTKTGKEHIKYETDNKGVVYIQHIPHGFYDQEIKDFFNQFGEVTAVNVPRNKNDRIKGYAFVQFKIPEVAKIAAESMDNYLMCNRLIKTKYIPPEQQKSHLFRKAESAKLRNKTVQNLAEMRRKRDAKIKMKHLDKKEVNQFNQKLKLKMKNLTKRFSALGMDFECQVAGGAGKGAAKLISVKKLDENSVKGNETLAVQKFNKLEKNIKMLEVISKKMLENLKKSIAQREKAIKALVQQNSEEGKSKKKINGKKLLKKQAILNKKVKFLKEVSEKITGNVARRVSNRIKSEGSPKQTKLKGHTPSLTPDDESGPVVKSIRPKRQTSEKIFLKKFKKINKDIKVLKKIREKMVEKTSKPKSTNKVIKLEKSDCSPKKKINGEQISKRVSSGKKATTLSITANVSAQIVKSITPKRKVKKETSL